MLDELKQEYHYNAQDSVLALRNTLKNGNRNDGKGGVL